VREGIWCARLGVGTATAAGQDESRSHRLATPATTAADSVLRCLRRTQPVRVSRTLPTCRLFL
jgi:hypothetical protein